MRREDNELAKLLGLNDLFLLYTKVGDSINNDIDLYNSGFDPVSRDNSMLLLQRCGFVAEEDELLIKKKHIFSIDDFSHEILKAINVYYSEAVDRILSLDKKYDEMRGLYYISQNSIDLSLSGLIMILYDLAFVQVMKGRVYILHEEALKTNDASTQNGNRRKMISLVELENKLAIKKEFGEIGEKKALEYEIKLLADMGIRGAPKIISGIDVTAGYDLVSFLSTESIIHDKFIEVKSCQDKSQAFYISNNELKTAEAKGDSYFLYIYLRDSDEVVVIRDPYRRIFMSEDWAKEPQVYRVHKIIDGDVI